MVLNRLPTRNGKCRRRKFKFPRIRRLRRKKLEVGDLCLITQQYPAYPIIRHIRQSVLSTFGIISYLYHVLKSCIPDLRHIRHDFSGPLRCRICRILLYIKAYIDLSRIASLNLENETDCSCFNLILVQFTIYGKSLWIEA